MSDVVEPVLQVINTALHTWSQNCEREVESFIASKKFVSGQIKRVPEHVIEPRNQWYRMSTVGELSAFTLVQFEFDPSKAPEDPIRGFVDIALVFKPRLLQSDIVDISNQPLAVPGQTQSKPDKPSEVTVITLIEDKVQNHRAGLKSFNWLIPLFQRFQAFNINEWDAVTEDTGDSPMSDGGRSYLQISDSDHDSFIAYTSQMLKYVVT